jgi:bacillithiol biosynthesis deacetylase BshB1
MSDEVDVLFCGAHPDDLELTSGATVARMTSEGLRVGVVELTRGEMGTRGTPAVRKREAQAAAKILRLKFRTQLDFGDGGLRTGRKEELELIDFIRRARPRIVFAPPQQERHPDHVRASHLVTDASYYAGLRQIHTKFAAHRPQAVIYYMQWYVMQPTFVVDVTAHWKTKMHAIAAFKSQFHDPKSKEPATKLAGEHFLKMIEARGIHFGSLIGTLYGEPFVTAQPPRIDDLIAAYAGREP